MMDMLSAGLPVKVLIEATDLLEEASVGTGHFAFGVRQVRLANTATALGGVFVVQTASSNLYALRERLGKAFAHRGAGLVSVYAGAGAVGELPPYLTAAAAMESRAFPAFTYDPYAGDNQAARFALADNPQPEADWPVAPFEYADETLQRVVEETPFTIADFLLCDQRYAGHFARVPRARWNSAMIPADEWLARDPKSVGDAIPYVLAVDPQDVLQRVIVDTRLMQMAARCRTFWHRLQEQGGVHNSHAEILLAREKARWEQAKASELDALKATAAAAASVPAAGAGWPRPHRRRRPRPQPAPLRRPRHPSATPTKRGSRPRAARAATSARPSTTRCSSTTTTSRRTSPTSSSAPIGSWSRRPRLVRCRSSIPASRGIRTSRASPSSSPGRSRSGSIGITRRRPRADADRLIAVGPGGALPALAARHKASFRAWSFVPAPRLSSRLAQA